jgi:hypothetical protein
MSKARDLANFVSTGNPLADGTLAVADISDLTASAAEINVLDGITTSTAELNILDGVTATASELLMVQHLALLNLTTLMVLHQLFKRNLTIKRLLLDQKPLQIRH